jgi:hypothetical protein
MTIEVTGPFETPASNQPDALQQNGVQGRERMRRFRSLGQTWPCLRGSDRSTPEGTSVGPTSEADLRGGKRITLDAASLPSQHGVNATRANGTRERATVSPLAIASAPALTLVTATGPLELISGEPESFIGGCGWQLSGSGFGRPGLNVGGGGT